MSDAPDSTTANRACPACGVPRNEWPDDADGGFDKHGVAFCCRGCAEGTGCTLKVAVAGDQAPTEEDLRKDPASADFVQSLQHQTETIGRDDYGRDMTGKKPDQSASGGPA